ncbi:Leucine-rich PPR motif-containing protein, mitochondrial [Pseudolycoriella hygida]|uniref:Leucine-rich PPR motif-containing protein, mitochondrial n=1 Tax=Pseudolycoriella hygida TaxID=35572 RepID=A0A9Q0MRN9_9DIPT|nr:Leucine-rich PPR motif-containing protein, mitochondrial [Pseudolycoriella hygida]
MCAVTSLWRTYNRGRNALHHFTHRCLRTAQEQSFFMFYSHPCKQNLVRKTNIPYRSKVVISSYRRNHQIETNKWLQDTERSTEKTNVNKNYKLEFLKSHASNNKRVSYTYLQNAVNVMVKKYLPPNNASFLLECCSLLPDTSKQEKSQLIDTIWNEGILKYGKPSKEQIILLLRAYRVIGRDIDDFNEFLAQHDCQGDKEIYEEFLHLTCENAAFSDGIVKALSDIKGRGFVLSENLFNALILGHSRKRNIENCEKVLDTMVFANLKPTSETYMQLVRAYIENGDVTKAKILLSEQGGTFSMGQIYSVIRTAALHDSTDLMVDAIKMLPEDTLFNKNVTPELQNICTELIHVGKFEVAYNIINNVPKIKLNETEGTDTYGVFFIKEMVSHNDNWLDILDVTQRLVDSGRNTRALHCCCEILLRNNSPNALECIRALGQKEPLRPHYFWPLFVHRYNVDGEIGIQDVLQEMKKLKVPVDQDTLTHYVLGKLPITMKNTKNAIQILSDRGIPIATLLTPVLSQLLYQFRIDEALKTITLHKTKVDSDLLLWPLIVNVRNFTKTSTIAMFAQLVHTIDERSKKGYCDLAGQILIGILSRTNNPVDSSIIVTLLEKFHAVGVKIPLTTCDRLLVHVQKELPVDCRKKATTLLRNMLDKTVKSNAAEQTSVGKHQRDMTIDELECHLIELQSKNMNARGVMRRLLQLLVRAGKLERALEVHQLCKTNNVDFSPGMLSSILDLMIRTKNLNEAETTLAQLKKSYPAFSIDEFKVIDLASLMIENDRVKDAKEILEERAKSKVLGGTQSSKNIWALLTNAAAFGARSGSTDHQSEEFLQFLVQLGYCTNHNTLLGPIIREHLLKNQLRNAMTQFENVATKHKKTPMHFELMTKLIEVLNSNADVVDISPIEAKEMLAKIMNIVTSVHGSPNAHVSLVVAFAKAGTEAQLRKVLINPNLELNPEMLVKQCEYLSVSSGEAPIFKLAKCSRGLGRISSWIKEQDLYNLLLDEYTRGNNYTAAMALFERITEDEEFRPSRDFSRKVADLLEKNNLELPSVLEMHLRKS